ncbi:MAG: sulfatase [Bacteroidetes bacterium]|nr:sulfatase [Bacteroidota bacterium]
MKRTKMKSGIFIAAILSISFFNIGCKKSTTTSKPNIIIFFTDDQGYGDLGCYGGKGFETPNIDQLAANGIRFTDFYVAASVCTPSRAALLTGKYPRQVNLHVGVISPFSTHGLAPNEITLPEVLKPVGYNTAMIGKWHLGHASKEFMPNNQGFDYYYGVPYSNDMDGHFYKHNNFQSPPLPYFKNTEQVAEGLNQDYLTKTWTEAAVEYINSAKEKPFFLYVAHNMPHTPWHASEKFRGSSELGLYGDIMQEIDWSMGEIVNALNENGIAENTIIIFTSDNGQQALKNGGSAGPLRGSKAQTWEGGMRVPGIISWPAKIKKGIVCTTPVTTMDLLPTLTNIVGGDIPENSNIKGRNISQILFHPEKENKDVFEFVYYSRDGKPEAIRQGNWKLHIAKSRGWNKMDGEFPLSLYNLKDDIGETKNVADEFPELVEKLTQRIVELDVELQ